MCQNNKQQPDPECIGMTTLSNMPSFPSSPVNDEGRKAGYCGCPENGCSPWLNDLFKQDKAGISYCDAITKHSIAK